MAVKQIFTFYLSYLNVVDDYPTPIIFYNNKFQVLPNFGYDQELLRKIVQDFPDDNDFTGKLVEFEGTNGFLITEIWRVS